MKSSSNCESPSSSTITAESTLASSNSNSLHILTNVKKLNNSNSIFIVPPVQKKLPGSGLATVSLVSGTSSSAVSISVPPANHINQFLSSFSPPLNASHNLAKLCSSTSMNPITDSNSTSSKITLKPLNISTSGGGVNSTASSPHSPNNGSKSTPPTTPIKILNSNDLLSSSPNKKQLIQINNGLGFGLNSSFTPTKNSQIAGSPIHTITATDALNGGPSANSSKIFTISTQNNSRLQANTGGNKIHYVKIVNTGSGSLSVAGTGATNANAGGIKITTISNSNGSIVNQQAVAKLNPEAKPATTTFQFNNSANNPTPLITTISAPTNTSTNLLKAPLIHRMSTHPITKTIVTTAPNTATTTTTTTTIGGPNYKILTQQLPAAASAQYAANPPPTTVVRPSVTQLTAIKSVNAAAFLNNSKTNTNPITTTNPVLITKTIGSSDQNKPFITTIRSGIEKNNPTSTISLTPIASNNGGGGGSIGLIRNVSHLSEIEKANNILSSSTQKQISSLSNNLAARSIVPSKVLPSSTTTSSIVVSASSSTLPPPISSQSILTSNLSTVSSTSNHPATATTSAMIASSSSNSNNRKPCNCTKSMCLKLYCDCFAAGSFCQDCNCINCFNNLEHEDERNKAIKMVLDRNPQAFQSKIGKFAAQLTLNKTPAPPTQAEIESLPVVAATVSVLDEIDETARHVKGCNCKKSNCLKRYCECFLAKIQCSTLCKCVGCKNCDESTKTLLQLANAADMRKQQQQQQFYQAVCIGGQAFSGSANQFGMANQLNRLLAGNSTSHGASNWLSSIELLTEQQLKQLEQQQALNREYAKVLDDKVEVTCALLIDRVSKHLEKIASNRMDEDKDEKDDDDETSEERYDAEIEKLIIREFGQCLTEIIETAEKRSLT